MMSKSQLAFADCYRIYQMNAMFHDDLIPSSSNTMHIPLSKLVPRMGTSRPETTTIKADLVPGRNALVKQRQFPGIAEVDYRPIYLRTR
jgi:hypothetical protein